MSNTKYLHFTIGPVQGFVSQSRRTRDLWAGSFLLAYLSGHAILAAFDKGGSVKFPVVHDDQRNLDDALLIAIAEQKKGRKITNGPTVGTLPNRFKAEVPAGFNPQDCVTAVQDAWMDIARVVWDEYIAPVAGRGNDVASIWNRQVKNFWDIVWAVSESEDSNNLLDMRKNWRCHVPEVEPGDKCSIMGNFQELSGYVRAREPQKQDAFWKSLRERTGLDLREDERLCAIATIKRFFPLLAGRAIGWGVPISYPSTTYIAATHWIEKAIREKAARACEYTSLVGRSKLAQRMGMQPGGAIKCIDRLLYKQPQLEKFAQLDGNLFHSSTLDNDGIWSEDTAVQRKELKEFLSKFDSQAGSYYAVLLMDGDEMGALLQKFAPRVVSDALARFSQRVSSIIYEENGVLIYAGGDDVLALLSLEDALSAAVSICHAYRDSFSNTGIPGEHATISAGILYAHHHAPLKSILNQSHHLLDTVAKDKTGRDSLAVGVWKSAGLNLIWSSPWEKVIVGKDDNIIDQMVNNFIGVSNEQRQYNSAFFYNVRKRFEILMDENQLISELNPVKLLAAEYLKNRERTQLDMPEAEKRMDKLISICRRSRREVKEDNIKIIQDDNLQIDGALLVRFLAEKGVGY